MYLLPLDFLCLPSSVFNPNSANTEPFPRLWADGRLNKLYVPLSFSVRLSLTIVHLFFLLTCIFQSLGSTEDWLLPPSKLLFVFFVILYISEV